MKKKTTLPTLLGVIILIAGLIAGIYMINTRQVFKLSANTEAIPRNVRFSNITDSNISVSWTTDVESVGFIKWGNSASNTSKVVLEENSNKSFVHSANIVGLENNTNIFIRINSESKDYDNGGAPWQSKTSGSPLSAGNSLIAAGTVLMPDTTTPAKAIVYLTINGTLLSSVTSDEGSYIIPISNYVENVNETTAIEISVNAGINGTSQAVIYPKAIKAVPTIIIGKTYDFRSLPANTSEEQPKSSLSIPESVEVSSRFEVEKNDNSGENTTVTIDSVKEGEIVTTTNPEFFGEGPKETDIQVSVESELQEAALTTDSSGVWNWSPPKDLEPGEHKVTIKWRDATGILRTLTKNFIVSASEGPAFESTPSATPIVEATATPISSTASATPTIAATAPPTPETGSLTPTIGLFILGIGMLLSSVFVWNKSYAERQ